jgi:hypothetical protein
MNDASVKPLGLPMFVWRLLIAAAVVAAFMLTHAGAEEGPCVRPAPIVVPSQPTQASWIFMRSRYTHDPATGVRVAQYDMKPPIEPLDDPRAVTSGYSRSRTIIRGADGSADTHYRVQSFGNGRGGLDAEWERFNDAWRGSTVAGGQYQGYGYGYGGYGYGGGYGGYGNGAYGNGAYGNGGFGGAPGYGYGGGYGAPLGGGAGFRNGGVPGFNSNGGVLGYGPGYGQPDAGRLDPDGADGYREQIPRTPDRQFFSPGLPPFRDLYQHHGGGQNQGP